MSNTNKSRRPRFTISVVTDKGARVFFTEANPSDFIRELSEHCKILQIQSVKDNNSAVHTVNTAPVYNIII